MSNVSEINNNRRSVALPHKNKQVPCVSPSYNPPVSGNIAYSNIKENDIFIVGEERIKVLNIDRKSSRIRVLRCADGTVGSSHSYSDILYEVPRRFSINQENSKFKLGDFGVNKEIYFIPKESLGIGATSGVGIGTTIFFANPGAGITQIFIPSKH